jgi:lipopolysaccharide transport system ATP-binding protein
MIAIRVENLGKRYRIGQQEQYLALRDVLARSLTAPLRYLRSQVGKFSCSQVSSSPPSNLRTVERANVPTVQPVNDGIIWALKDVSFEVKQGEVVGIIGRNGAGKSTLLKLLSRITRPTDGCAKVYGRVGSLLEVGTGFHPELTGRENTYLNGAILGMKKAEIDRKFDEIVAFAEVEKFIDTPVKHYSSGMHMRLAFAVAAYLEPEILLVDEVLAVGDAEFQKKCLGLMGEVAKGGRTVLFVSHNLLALQSLCTRGILLTSGRISAEGPIKAVIDQYLNSGREQSGEVCWATPDVALGNTRVCLKAVRIVSDGIITGDVDISKECSIEVDYWNLEENSRRLVSIHLYNSTGVCVLTSANTPSVSLQPDEWYTRRYPIGLFRTSCTIPGCFLNDGLHSITVYINERGAQDNVLLARDVLTFTVRDTGLMRKEYLGVWIGAVRPRLGWQTIQLS